VAAAEAVAPAPAGAEAGAEAMSHSLRPEKGAGAGGGIRADDVKVELTMTKSLKNVLVSLGGGVKDSGKGVIENSARPTLNHLLPLLLLFEH